jgi:hypothetical protein
MQGQPFLHQKLDSELNSIQFNSISKQKWKRISGKKLAIAVYLDSFKLWQCTLIIFSSDFCSRKLHLCAQCQYPITDGIGTSTRYASIWHVMGLAVNVLIPWFLEDMLTLLLIKHVLLFPIKWPFRRPRQIWVDSVKVDFGETGYERRNSMELVCACLKHCWARK